MNKAHSTKTKKAKPRAKSGQSQSAAAQRRLIFAESFLTNNENATQAAIDAGFSPKTAAQAGCRLLKNVEVQQIINSRRAEVAQKYHITTERILQEVARLALFDPRKLFNTDGTPKPIHELDDDTAAAVAGLDVIEEFEGSGKDRAFIGYTKKYKVADKNSALEKLMKFKGLYEKDNEQNKPPDNVTVTHTASASLLGALKAKINGAGG